MLIIMYRTYQNFQIDQFVERFHRYDIQFAKTFYSDLCQFGHFT